jgi:hypothetical protein
MNRHNVIDLTGDVVHDLTGDVVHDITGDVVPELTGDVDMINDDLVDLTLDEEQEPLLSRSSYLIDSIEANPIWFQELTSL